MANYDSLINAVQAAVKTNGTGAITGATLQATLLGTIQELTVGFQFMGVATPETTPDSNDKKEFYIGFAGTYANFGSSVTVPEGSVILFKKNNSAWSSQVVKIVDPVSVSQNLETGQDILNIGSDNYPLVSSKEINSNVDDLSHIVLKRKIASANFTINGYYVSYIAQIDSSHPEYGLYSTPLFNVKEGEIIHLRNLNVDITPSMEESVCFCFYKADGTPYNGTNARISWGNLTQLSRGNFTFIVPENAEQIGFSFALDFFDNDSYINILDVSNLLYLKTSIDKSYNSDFLSLPGYYKPDVAELDTTHPEYGLYSNPLIDVAENDTIFMFGFSGIGSISSMVFCLYKADGTPYNGTNARINWNDLESVGNGVYKYTIPQGAEKIGFSIVPNVFIAESKIVVSNNAKNNIVNAKMEEVYNYLNPLFALFDSIVTSEDFTIEGYYKSNVAEIDTTHPEYELSSVPLIDVEPGNMLIFNKFPVTGLSYLAFCLYKADGTPYNGTNARINWEDVEDLGNNVRKYIIPNGAMKLGLSSSIEYFEDDTKLCIFNSASAQDQSAILERLGFLEYDNKNGDFAFYYLKGKSNVVFDSNKKIGIVAAGQSNIDGRNPINQLPSGFVNPNSKVQFCSNENGTFADCSLNSTFGFDSITYDSLTNTNYGNQDQIFVMKKSMGNTSIDSSVSGSGAEPYHWTPDYEFLSSPNYALLKIFENIIRAGKNTQGNNFEIRAFLWHQGEADAFNMTTAKRYYSNLRNVIAYIRGVVGNPRLHFFCGNLSEMGDGVPADRKAVINAAFDKLAQEDYYFHCVDLRQAPLQDNVHLNSASSIYFGQKVYDLMVDFGVVNGTKINPATPW